MWGIQTFFVLDSHQTYLTPALCRRSCYILQGYLLYKYSWNDSSEKTICASSHRYAEKQDTNKDLPFSLKNILVLRERGRECYWIHLPSWYYFVCILLLTWFLPQAPKIPIGSIIWAQEMLVQQMNLSKSYRSFSIQLKWPIFRAIRPHSAIEIYSLDIWVL